MRNKKYPTDLHDSEWERLKLLLSPPNQPPKRGRPTEVEYREIVNALLYVTRSGCAWELLPHDFHPSGTVFSLTLAGRAALRLAGAMAVLEQRFRGEAQE